VTAEPHQVHIDPVPRGARDFQGRRAGVVTRTIAGAVDYLIVAVAVLGTYVGWGVLLFLFDPRSFSWPRWSFLAFLGLGWGYLFCYLAIGWMATGRTVGARLMGVRVVNFRGQRLRPVGAVLRSAFCVVFPIGLFWCALSAANRSVQDVVLRTSVVYDWTSRTPRP
jgi:uncharacterized RDD family membrane protein YckC